MAAKKKTVPDISTMFDDPIPNPYPEFESEVFQMYRDMGMIPSDILDNTAVRYEQWLIKNGEQE